MKLLFFVVLGIAGLAFATTGSQELTLEVQGEYQFDFPEYHDGRADMFANDLNGENPVHFECGVNPDYDPYIRHTINGENQDFSFNDYELCHQAMKCAANDVKVTLKLNLPKAADQDGEVKAVSFDQDC